MAGLLLGQILWCMVMNSNNLKQCDEGLISKVAKQMNMNWCVGMSGPGSECSSYRCMDVKERLNIQSSHFLTESSR